MSSLLVVNIGEAVSAPACPARGQVMRTLSIYKAAALYSRDGIIVSVGPRDEVERQVSDDPLFLDATDGTVIPGFVDGHTHLVVAEHHENEFGSKKTGATYQQIAAAGGGILSTVAETRRATVEELTEIALGYLASALRHGTTTLEVKSGYGLDLENELKMLDVIAELKRRQPIELVATFLGAHAVPPGTGMAEQTQNVIAMLPHLRGKAEFCDVFCEGGYFGLKETRAIFEAARAEGLKLRLHADQLSRSGGVILALEMGARSVDHLEQIGPEDISLLAASDCCATLLPGVSLFLNYGFPPARRLMDSGAIVALATNFNPGSCMCLNMQMICSLACMQMHMTTAEVLTAVTANAAWGLDRLQIGRLAPGLQADFLLLDVSSFRLMPYFFGESHVLKVIKKGEIVFDRT